MASSSSSSSSSSCLVSEINYEVFLSFRGEDTRDNFTSHLYAALCRKKIKTFIDDEELKRGDEISPALLNAIEESKISVLIFSKDYASSKWCLNELVKILECQKLNGQIVIPIFYHVTPSDVRKQKGTFEKAFVEHEKKFKEMPELVKKWRAALSEASNLSGWDSMVTRPEGKLVDEIVKDVLKKLEGLSISSDFESCCGLNLRVEEIESLLCIGLPDFRVVGIWGMGGIGKTTIAGALFNQMSGKFEGKCFMANVREELEKGVGLVHLQEQILSQILEENTKVSTLSIPQYIRERLRRMKVLIVLDDVNKFGQLELLAGGPDQFGSGSRIIVTTRDKQVLDKYGVDYIYEVKGLNYYEAVELFCNYALRQTHRPHDLMQFLNVIVDYTKGNPLALKVLGSSLYQKSKQDWENALHNLQRISDPDIYDVLKISYDELNWEEKNLFLDIACFFKGEEKDCVTMILEDRYSMHYGLDVLLDKSLITISFNRLQIHDLLQEMGQKIVREESEKEPAQRSRLWHHEDVYHVLKKNKGTDSIEGLCLDMSKIRDIHLNSGAFANMPNLRLLKFCMPGSFEVSIESSNVHLPQGLEYLSDELRYLYWHGYPFKTLPSNFSAENLTVLRLPNSKVEQLWVGQKEAFKLKWIDLHHSRHLTSIPNPLEIPNLERINLCGCTNLPRIPSSIQDFSKLCILDLQDCKSFRSFPSNIHFRSPIVIDLSNCVNLREFPQISGNVKEIHLRGTAIKEVSESIECLTELVGLNLMGCTELKSLSASFCKLKSLHWLNLDDCWRLESFPEIFEKMACLEYISLASKTDEVGFSGCRGLILPPFPGLSSLTRLNLSYRNILEMPQDISCLSSLRSLDLRGNNFENLPASIKQLSRLKYLMLSHCHMLHSLPELPVSSLNYLEAMDCQQLKSMPEMPLYLEEIDASKLEELPKPYPEFSRPGAGKLIRFMFTNCMKLNQKAYNTCLADSELRIQHMATASLRVFYGKKFDKPPVISICLPGSQIPDWFNYQSSGSSITIQLPRHWCNVRFMGFAICVVIALVEKDPPAVVENIGVSCTYCFGTQTPSETKYSSWLGFLTGASRISGFRIVSDHVVLGFDPYSNIELPNCDHHTVASFKFSFIPSYRNGCKVKSCGVSPLYANPNLETVQHSYYGASVKEHSLKS